MTARAPFDHHVHAELSGDSSVPLEERARTAREERPHGISEHFPSSRLRDDDDVLRYIERARGLGLAVALEYDIGVAPPLRASTRDALDYLVGGLHQVTIGERRISYDAAGDFLKRRAETYADASLFADEPALGRRVLEEILRALARSFERDRVDVLAHPTFSPLAALGDPEASYPREWQDRLIALCVSSRVAIELNESYRVPHRAFVERARRAGARFAVGSDSHRELVPLRYTLGLVADANIRDRLRDQVVSGSSATSS
jgi:histidinol phosphatase-like PHP family hydrolase